MNNTIWLFQSLGKKSQKAGVALEIFVENEIVLSKICQENELG